MNSVEERLIRITQGKTYFFADFYRHIRQCCRFANLD